MHFDLSGQHAVKDVRLWIPYPVSNTDQSISNIRIDGDFADSSLHTLQDQTTQALYVEWPGASKSRQLTLSFDVSRKELRHRDLPKQDAAWQPANLAVYLEPTKLGPTDGAVKELAERIIAGKTTVLAKSKAIYDWTVENMYRDPATIGCGKGDVCYLLKNPGGKCTDISSVYVALCRAAGVPAREIFGLRLGKEATQDVTGWQHCWAEFYLPGHGWVPVDPADVRKLMLKEGVAIDTPRTVELRNYFWGGIDAYRVQLAHGRDLTLAPAQAGDALNTFGYPYAEVDGEPLDFYNPQEFVYRFEFKED
jgi:transglutaminase-like putative cysteine protease